MIDITMIGTSALLPLPDRALTSALLVCGGHSILFDCGEGTQTAARKAGVSLMKTDLIALTHYHGDHILGIPGLLQTLFSMGRQEPLYIAGPAGLAEAMAPILILAGLLPYEVRLLEIPEEGLVLNSLIRGWPEGARLTPFSTVHRIVSQGYVFSLPRPGKFLPDAAMELGIPQKNWSLLQRGNMVIQDGRTVTPDMVMGPPRKGLKVVFSGDTSRCAGLTKAARNADLLICDATYGENEQQQRAIDYGHMNFAQAAQTAADAEAKRLWLVHYSQMMENPEDYLHNARSIFPAAQCCRDGEHITLSFED